MKPFRVVCISDHGYLGEGCPKSIRVIKGEIYTVVGIYNGLASGVNVKDWYILYEFGSDYAYEPSLFREVDSTFGPAVCEQIEQIIELEETIEI